MSRAVSGTSDQDRIAGALLGLAAGDALGSTLEFLDRATVLDRYGGNHCDLLGGGVFGWRPGEGTDDTDLTWAVTETYLAGYSVRGVAERMLAWHRAGPRDVGGMTAAGLAAYGRGRDPHRSGVVAARGRRMAAGNGSLMRAAPTGLVRTDPEQRRRESAEISAITHVDPRAVQACVAYCELLAALMDGADPADSLRRTVRRTALSAEVRAAMLTAPQQEAHELDPSGFVLSTLSVAVWALVQPISLEEALVAVVNLGGDADTNGAVAGALLGARHGVAAIPKRWTTQLEYGPRIRRGVPALAWLRRCGAPSGTGSAGENEPGLGKPDQR